MPWLLIKLAASGSDADAVADALSTCGALSVSIESATDEERLQREREPTPLWSENRVTALFPQRTDPATVIAELCRTLGGNMPLHQIDLLEDADWERAWMANYQPLQVAPTLWVVPSWCPPADANAINLILDPGLAFGTGAHPTTALCLAWLAALPLAARTVIDYGCGSGILAIAALKLGAARAIGVDIDPQALATSRENAAYNGVAERYQAVAVDALAFDISADVLVANILSDTLIPLCAEFSRRIEPRGQIGLSGILTEQAQEVRRAYAPHFVLDVQERDGWVLLAGHRKP